MTDQPSSHRRWLAWTLRIVVLVLVCLGVSGTVRNALAQLSQHEWHVRPVWLAASGALYAVGLLPMAWFWHRALASLGRQAPWPAVIRAYFLGHLGKYVPGKALAVILRVTAVSKWVPSIRVAMASALLETLTMMAVGAFLAAVLLMIVRPPNPKLAALAFAIALAIGLPTLPPVARWLARIGTKRITQSMGEDENETSLRGFSMRLLVEGWFAAAVCWLMLGLSLWATLRAVGVVELDPIADLPRLIAAVALAVVAGFVSMLPGGLGVRDLALVELLAESCGAANALIATVLIRLVWLVSEVVACVILYVGAKFR